MSKPWSKEYWNENLLPFPDIAAAVAGDTVAISLVLKHFEGYIITMSMRQCFDEYGSAKTYLDEELRCCLETTLISRILNFDIT